MQDKKSSTLLWVQTTAMNNMGNGETDPNFYIPRPTLQVHATTRNSEGSRRDCSSAQNEIIGVHNAFGLSLVNEKLVNYGQSGNPSPSTSSNASTASSQLSNDSGKPIVDQRKSWLPSNPPPLQVSANIIKQQHQVDSAGVPCSRDDGDNVSIASSTHFTVIGTGSNKAVTSSCCCCSNSHRLTKLVLTMSFIFLTGITAAVFMLEARMQQTR